MKKVTKVLLALLLAAGLVAGGFFAGVAFGRLPTIANLKAKAGTTVGSSAGSKVDAVNTLLQNEALNPPSETSATAGSIQGLLDATGDRYAVYFDAKDFEYFNQETQGSFGGIGVVLAEDKDGRSYVAEVYPGTPAEKAGLKAGDIFYEIDGVKRDKWSSDEVVSRARGEVGTKLTLTMLRPSAEEGGQPTEKAFTLTREEITVPNITSKVIDGVGYIRLDEFNAKATDDVRKAVTDLTAKGAHSFVLDLRDNPGGLLDQAIKVSSLFIRSGVAVRVDQRDKPEEVHEVTGDTATDAPLVVLINGNSASASEIVAGALQDYGRAKLVGETSFGKGSVQTIEQLADGSAVKFTIAHYLTPKSRTIDGIGLTPDVVVKMDAALQAQESSDTQLQEALRLAREAK